MKEKVILVGLKSLANKESFDASMDELVELAKSAGAEVVSIVSQNSEPNPRTFIGSGKLKEIAEIADNMEIDTIIFNSELSGSQIKNLESITGKKIIDRTNLILDIFATRAKTTEAVLQVSLAQAEYILPRLIGYGNQLSRTGGGIGTRGPGEQQLETDRRHIRSQISRIKKRLKDQEKTRETRSKKRNDSDIPIVSLFGYTNVGKSTIMNRIMEFTDRKENSKVYADDRLFATLQTSHRHVDYKGKSFILADTVGLIEDLPVNLIEAFKSTLEEAAYADLLLIVLDGSSDNLERQISSTMSTIEELEIGHIKKLIIYNKMDKCKDKTVLNSGGISEQSIQISAISDEGIEKLLDKIKEILNEDKITKKILIPYKESNLYGRIMDKYQPIIKEARDEGIYLEVEMDIADIPKIAEYEVT